MGEVLAFVVGMVVLVIAGIVVLGVLILIAVIIGLGVLIDRLRRAGQRRVDPGPVLLRCPRCQTLHPPGARFCSQCAAPLEAPRPSPPPAQVLSPAPSSPSLPPASSRSRFWLAFLTAVAVVLVAVFALWPLVTSTPLRTLVSPPVGACTVQGQNADVQIVLRGPLPAVQAACRQMADRLSEVFRQGGALCAAAGLDLVASLLCRTIISRYGTFLVVMEERPPSGRTLCQGTLSGVISYAVTDTGGAVLGRIVCWQLSQMKG